MTAVYGETASAFIARSGEEYVEKVVGLAGRVGELRKQRPALRQQVLNSNLCNPTAFTQAFAQALRD